MTDPEQPDRPDEGLPPELADALRRLTGGADLPPEVVQQLRGMGLDRLDPAMMQGLTEQFRAMFETPLEGPVNATLAKDVARRTVAAEGDRSMGDREQELANQAARVADLWLGAVTSLDASGLHGVAWSRAEWVEATMPVWQRLVAPVARGVADAIGGAMRSQVQQLGEGALPAGLLPPGTDPAALLGQMEPMVQRMSASMFGAQLGQAVGGLAAETLTGMEVTLPLLPDQVLALLPDSIAALTEGLEVEVDEVWLYLAVREAARIRLFTAVPWLGPQVLTAVEDYARDIRIDTEQIEASIAGVDPSDPEALQSALQDNLFAPDPSPAQRAALSRLETYLALIEGWVDVVADKAAAAHLPHAAALGETVRRRRATGGPAEKTFAALVGLELRPRRLRDAANLFAALESSLGADGRDRAWAHPDVAPTAADLDDPLGYVERVTKAPQDDAALDEELGRLLDEGGSPS